MSESDRTREAREQSARLGMIDGLTPPRENEPGRVRHAEPAFPKLDRAIGAFTRVITIVTIVFWALVALAVGIFYWLWR